MEQHMYGHEESSIEGHFTKEYHDRGVASIHFPERTNREPRSLII